MKWAFIVDRLSYNKWFAPLMDEGLSRGYEVEAWLNQKDISQTTKWYEFPSADKMPTLRNGKVSIRTFEGPAELQRISDESEAEVVFLCIHR